MTDKNGCLPGMTQTETEALVRVIVAEVVRVMAERGFLVGGGLAPNGTSARAGGITPGPIRKYGFQGRLVTEEVVTLAMKAGHSVLCVAPGTIVTPLAKDTAREKGVSIIME